jgi:glyoxylase-like metal-dependent hydrolase (beta-lactamase superfamily II)
MSDFRPVTPHIWRLNLEWDLKIPFYPPIPVAVWLVKEGDDWSLVDAGHPVHTGLVVEAVARFLGPTQPAHFILTHAHIDHGGSLAEIVKRWQLPIWAHPLEVDFITGAKRYRDIASASWIYNVAKPFMAEVAWQQSVARSLVEGDRVGELEVVHVPGHTPGMIALHHHADRAIIAGDTFMNLGRKLSAPMPLSTPDPSLARRSIRKLAARDYDTLLPSHDASEQGVSADAVRRFVDRLGL